MKKILLLGLLSLLLAAPPAFAANITAVWANDGEDKVTRDELRAAKSAAGVINGAWDGTRINIFGGRNETVSFNVVVEASGNAAASNVTVSFNRLDGPSGSSIVSSPAAGNGVFDWTRRPIELFYVRYLAIKGLSKVSYETYDERHVPRRFRLTSGGGWTNRPDHDKFYPEIAVPLELVPGFTVAAKNNQSVWADVYIPKTAAPGIYQGALEVREGGTLVKSIPVRLDVRSFTLPDTPSAKTMLYYSSNNINRRYMGSAWVDPNSSQGSKGRLLRDRHFLLAHRHRFSLIGDVADDCGVNADRPCPEWEPRLNGSLFTAANGYDGPGVNTGNNVYSIGTYGQWSWRPGTQADMRAHTDAWATWFNQNSPNTERFLYLIDESPDTAQIETWSKWIATNPGPGGQLRSLATIPLTIAASQCPTLDIPTSALGVGVASEWGPLADRYTRDGRKRFYMYNGSRPSAGTTATEDDGVALRERAWAQFKLNANRWFFWETTYYNDYQGGSGEMNLFQSAHTFGGGGTQNASLGETGWNYSNGDGVLFYPGTDVLYPADSYGVDGPFASLRMKHWRRGLQDVDYLTLAAAGHPTEVQALVKSMVPKAAWEYGVTDPNDPTYVLTDVSWSDDPAVWEAARAKLADMLSSPSAPPPPPGLGAPTFDPPASVMYNGQLTAAPPAGAASIASYNWTVTPSTPPAGTSAVKGSGPVVNMKTTGNTLPLTPLNLSGYYVVSVTVTDSAGAESPAAAKGINVTTTAPRQARVYPNPWRGDRHAGMPVTFEQPVDDFTVDITNAMSGRHVKTLTSSGGYARWDLTNESGRKVASGTYIYVVKAAGQRLSRGRLAVIK